MVALTHISWNTFCILNMSPWDFELFPKLKVNLEVVIHFLEVPIVFQTVQHFGAVINNQYSVNDILGFLDMWIKVLNSGG